jgi:hypothetical protein
MIILAAFIVFAANATSKEKIITKTFPKDASYFKYNGLVTDLLDGSTYDTITFVLTLDKPFPMQVYTKTWFTLKGTADTTIACTFSGKVFDDDAYTLMGSGTYAGSADAGVVLSTIGLDVSTSLFDTTKTTYGAVQTIVMDSTKKWHTGTDRGLYTGTIGIDNPKKMYTATITKSLAFPFYRTLRLRYIIAGNDHTGTGVYLHAIEFTVKEQH